VNLIESRIVHGFAGVGEESAQVSQVYQINAVGQAAQWDESTPGQKSIDDTCNQLGEVVT
jgi:hypothetical protein